MEYGIASHCTEADAEEMVHACNRAGGHSPIRSLGIGVTWMATLEAILASPMGQATLAVIEGYIERGMIVKDPVPSTT